MREIYACATQVAKLLNIFTKGKYRYGKEKMLCRPT